MEPLEPRWLLSASNTFSEFQLATGSDPEKVVVGKDGSVYVYENATNMLARKRPGKPVEEIPMPGNANQHFGMAVSKGGDIYFSIQNGIGAYTPKFNRTSAVDLGTDTTDMAPGPKSSIWFTEPNTNKIGRLDLAHVRGRNHQFLQNAPVTTYDVPTANAGLASITLGPHNDMWFGEDFVGQLGQAVIDKNGVPTITEHPLPAGVDAHPVGITTGPDHNVWFAEVFANKVGRIDVNTDQVTEFDVPTANSEPFWITTGPDKNLWFVERAAGKVASITTNGDITEYDAPGGPNSFLTSIVRGKKKTLYFTETFVDRVGVLTLKK